MREKTNYSSKYESSKEKAKRDNADQNDRTYVSDDVALEAIVKVKQTQVLNLRPERNTNSEPIKQLKNGENLIVTGMIDDWAKVITETGAEGYVLSEYVQFV